MFSHQPLEHLEFEELSRQVQTTNFVPPFCKDNSLVVTILQYMIYSLPVSNDQFTLAKKRWFIRLGSSFILLSHYEVILPPGQLLLSCTLVSSCTLACKRNFSGFQMISLSWIHCIPIIQSRMRVHPQTWRIPLPSVTITPWSHWDLGTQE